MATNRPPTISQRQLLVRTNQLAFTTQLPQLPPHLQARLFILLERPRDLGFLAV